MEPLGALTGITVSYSLMEPLGDLTGITSELQSDGAPGGSDWGYQ